MIVTLSIISIIKASNILWIRNYYFYLKTKITSIMSKPRIIKDYDKLDEIIQEQIKLNYPRGFEKFLIMFKNAQNKLVSALPFETEERYYLIRMSRNEAQEIISDDEDYDDSGNLKRDVRLEYEEKYDEDMDEAEQIAND